MPGDSTADIQSLRSDLKGLRDLVDDRRQADKEAVAAALAAAEKAVNAALASAEKAAEKFDQSLKEYKTVSNEWRGTVEGLVVQLRELSELRQQIKSVDEKIADLRESRSTAVGQGEGRLGVRTDVKWAIGLVAGAIAGYLLSHFVK
jgi:hypothetical protein